MATITIGTGETYTTISAAWSALPATLTSDETFELKDQVYDEKPSLTGKASGGYTFTLKPGSGAGHGLARGTGARIIPTATGAGTILTIGINGAVIDGIAVSENMASVSSNIIGIFLPVNSDNTHVKNCFVYDLTSPTANNWATGIKSGDLAYDVHIYRNVVINCTGAGTGKGVGISPQLYAITGSHSIYCYNNTVYSVGDRGYSVGAFDTTATIVCKNNIGMGAGVVDFLYDNSDFGPGAGTITTNANLSSDATADDNADGTHYISETASNIFVDLTGGAEDLHIQSGTNAIDNGENLGSTYATDIDGDSVTTWDIGADEYVASGTTVSGASDINSSGVATFSGESTASAKSAISSQSSALWAGASSVSAALLNVNQGNVTWNGAAITDAALLKTVQAIVAWNGASTAFSDAAIDINAAAIVSWLADSTVDSAMVMNGVSNILWNGAVITSADMSAAAQALVTWNGGVIASGVMSKTATALAVWVGEAIAAGSGAISINSAAQVLMEGAATVDSAIDINTLASALFASDAAVTTPTEQSPAYGHEGGGVAGRWGQKKAKQKKRIQRDDEELYQMIQMMMAQIVHEYEKSDTYTLH